MTKRVEHMRRARQLVSRFVGLHAGEQADRRGLLVYRMMSQPRLEDRLRMLEPDANLLLARRALER